MYKVVSDGYNKPGYSEYPVITNYSERMGRLKLL